MEGLELARGLFRLWVVATLAWEALIYWSDKANGFNGMPREAYYGPPAIGAALIIGGLWVFGGFRGRRA